MSSPTWSLPEIITLDSFGGDWERFFVAIYECFRRDFVYSRPVYKGQRLGLKSHPVIEGKEATFWHLISDGETEAERLPDLRRCERICWPRYIIENLNDPSVKVWENVRSGKKRTLLWVEDAEYLVVIAERTGYALIWTAYTVTRNNQKAKLRREYEAFVNP